MASEGPFQPKASHNSVILKMRAGNKCVFESQQGLAVREAQTCLGVRMLWHAQEQILWHLRISSGVGRRIQLVQAALAKLEQIWRRRECPLVQTLGCARSRYCPVQQRHRPLERLIRGDYWLLK